jgi:hypothetical protein
LRLLGLARSINLDKQSALLCDYLAEWRIAMPKRTLAGAIIILGVILIISALIYWGFSETIAGSDEAKLPNSLANLPLTTVTYGSEAVDEITRLHAKEFPLTSGAMGMYGSNDEATLWVAGFANDSTAEQIVRAMQEKIASVSSPFTPTGEEQVGGRTIYQLDGMGQKHFYFQSANLVIWLAADQKLLVKQPNRF